MEIAGLFIFGGYDLLAGTINIGPLFVDLDPGQTFGKVIVVIITGGDDSSGVLHEAPPAVLLNLYESFRETAPRLFELGWNHHLAGGIDEADPAILLDLEQCPNRPLFGTLLFRCMSDQRKNQNSGQKYYGPYFSYHDILHFSTLEIILWFSEIIS